MTGVLMTGVRRYAGFVFVPAGLIVCVPAQATVYMSVEEAQQAIFPGAQFTPMPVRLTDAQREKIEELSAVTVRSDEQQVWRVAGGGFFILDQVLGKHEYITYAVGLDAQGAVRGIEILEYRESYGSQIRGAEWRAQFTGKTSASPLRLDEDIKNIGGATLSSLHITNGVKRLLAFYDVVLK